MSPNHCVSLELSRELKENGYPQEGEMWWMESYWGDGTMIRWDIVSEKDKDIGENSCVSPLATELLERLPVPLLVFTKMPKGKKEIQYIITYADTFGKNPATTIDESLPNALAKMWLYLRKEKLI